MGLWGIVFVRLALCCAVLMSFVYMGCFMLMRLFTVLAAAALALLPCLISLSSEVRGMEEVNGGG